VAIAIVSDRHVRALNRTYRGADYATDVLSFPHEPELQAPGSRLQAPGTGLQARGSSPRDPGSGLQALGDIVIARGVAARQAREAGHALATELRVLALHGLLHLLGYDHERDHGEMARIERRLRRRAGLDAAGLIERGGGA
jgi:probable rRNA maturation factor